MEQKIIIIIIKTLHQINAFTIVFLFFFYFQVLITGTLCNIFLMWKCQSVSLGQQELS